MYQSRCFAWIGFGCANGQGVLLKELGVLLFYISGPQLGVILLLRGHLTMSEDMFDCRNPGEGHLLDRG